MSVSNRAHDPVNAVERDSAMSADTTTTTDGITTEAPVTDGITLTETAAAKVKALLESEGRDDLALRVAVQPGGCSRPAKMR